MWAGSSALIKSCITVQDPPFLYVHTNVTTPTENWQSLCCLNMTLLLSFAPLDLHPIGAIEYHSSVFENIVFIAMFQFPKPSLLTVFFLLVSTVYVVTLSYAHSKHNLFKLAKWLS